MCRQNPNSQAVRAKFGEFLSNSTLSRALLLCNGGCQVLLGLASIGVWGHMLKITWDTRRSPIVESAGIWCGFLAIVPGFAAILALWHKCYTSLSVHLWMSIGLISAFSQYIRLAVNAYQWCHHDLSLFRPECRPYPLVGKLALVCVIFSAILMFTVFVAMATGFYMWYKCRSCGNSCGTTACGPTGTQCGVDNPQYQGSKPGLENPGMDQPPPYPATEKPTQY